MVGWHHQHCEHEFEQALGVGGREGSLGNLIESRQCLHSVKGRDVFSVGRHGVPCGWELGDGLSA